MKILLDLSFLAAGSAHLAVDLLNSQLAIILAFLSISLGLTNTHIGLISMIYMLTASLSQPLFGLLADRVGSRWVATLGILWMSGLFALGVLFPGVGTLFFLVFAALGSGAFHPAGTMQATLLGREHFSGRANTAAAMFFLFGQVGLSLGPAIGGLLIDRMELSGLTLLLLFVVPVGLFAGRNWSQSTTPEKQPEVQDDNPRFVFRSAIPFILLVAFRSWSQANMTAFLPKYYSDLGFRPAVYGSITALFMAGSALGNLTGGYLGDRITGRSVVVGTLLLATVPMALFPVLGPTGWAYLLVLVIGFLTGAPHSILVVIAQRFFPGRMGMASGVILGFMFASGSFGTMLSGIQADWLGFNAVFLTTAGVVLLGAFLGNKLPRFSQDTTFSSQT